MKRRLAILSLFSGMVLPLLVGFAPLRQGIDLTASAGYSGFYRRGLWTPVKVTAANEGDDLTGEVRVRVGEVGGLEETTYRVPVDLPRGSRKQLFLYVSLEDFASSIQVEIVDEQGHIVERETVDLRIASSDDILYAVITESLYGAEDISALSPGTGAARQTNWRIDDIPPRADALEGLDVILFHDVDTGVLTEDQRTAVANWVLAGGHLIVTGGDAWQRTTAGLLPLLPVTLQGTTPLDSLAELARYLKQPETPLDEPITAANSVPADAAQVLVAIGGVPLLVRKTAGSGTVDFLAVDPHAQPLRSWSQRGILWYTLVASVGPSPTWSRGFVDWSMARQATLTTSNTVLPTFLQLCGFLTLYIVLVGPVNYLVLKRLNRREWAWFTIPVLIGLFSVLAYSVGFNLRGNVPTVNRLTVVRAWPGQDRAQVMSLIGVQSPRRVTYDVAVERGYSLRTLPEEGIGLNVPATISEGTRFIAEAIPIDAGTVGSLSASGTVTLPQLEASATWHLSGDQPPRLTGRIVNTTGLDFHDVVLLIKGEARFLGEMPPGGTHEFDIPMGPQDPGPLTLGNPQFRYAPSSAPYNPWGYSSGSPGWCFTYQGLPITIPDVMRGEKFPCSARSVTPRQQEIRRRYRLLASLVIDHDLSGGRGAGVYLFAWTDQALVGIELLDRRQQEEDTTLYIFELPVITAADSDIVEVPPALTTWTVAAKNDPATMQQISPASFQVTEGSQAAFQFMPLPELRLAEVEELAVKFEGQGAVVELWNWNTGLWEPVTLDTASETTLVQNPARFIGPENMVNLRVLPENQAAYNRVDYVQVAYRGRLAGAAAP